MVEPGRTRAKPGMVLKACRTERGWTLADVSMRTGLSVSTLSKVENDKMALTYDKLVRLSEGLEIDLSRLFGPTGAAGMGTGESATRRSVSRAGEGKSIETVRGNYLYVATDLLNKQMTPIVGEVFATNIMEYGEFMRHSGEEYIYILQGTLELHTRMYAPIRLEVGDSVYFDSGMEHAYIAVGPKPCRILSVCSGPERKLTEALEALPAGPPAASAPRVIRAAAAQPKKRTRRSA